MSEDNLCEKYLKFKKDINSASLLAEMDSEDYPERSKKYIYYKYDAGKIADLNFILRNQVNRQDVYDELISLTEALVKELRTAIPYYKDVSNVPEPLSIWIWPGNKEVVSWDPCQHKNCKSCIKLYKKSFNNPLVKKLVEDSSISLKYCAEEQNV